MEGSSAAKGASLAKTQVPPSVQPSHGRPQLSNMLSPLSMISIIYFPTRRIPQGHRIFSDLLSECNHHIHNAAFTTRAFAAFARQPNAESLVCFTLANLGYPTTACISTLHRPRFKEYLPHALYDWSLCNARILYQATSDKKRDHTPHGI